MASWQVTGRVKTGFAALAGAVAVSLIAPAAADASAVNNNTSSPNDDHRPDAANVQAHQKATPGGGSGPAASSPQQSSANASSPGQSHSSSPSPSQTKDRPPDRGAHKFSPQHRTPAGSPGSSSGSSPTSRVGVDRPAERSPNKVTPQQRTTPPEHRRDKPGPSSSAAQPGRSGANGTAMQQLQGWVPKKPKRVTQRGNHDLVYRYRIVNGQKVDATANPLDWNDWLNDLWDQIGQFNMAYGKQFYDYGKELLDLLKLGFNTRIDRFITDRAGWNATTAELIKAVQDDWSAKIDQIVAVSEDPVGETQKFLDTEWNKLTSNPGAYLGELTGQGVILSAEALAAAPTGGASLLGSAARHGLRDAIDIPEPKKLPDPAAPSGPRAPESPSGAPDPAAPSGPRAPEAPSGSRAPETVAPGRTADQTPAAPGRPDGSPAPGRPDGSPAPGRPDGPTDRGGVPAAGNGSADRDGVPSARNDTADRDGVPATGNGSADRGPAAPREVRDGERQATPGAPVTRRPASFGHATSSNYRKTFGDAHPESRDKVVVHHAVERQAVKRYPAAEITQNEMHSIENLRGIPKEMNSRLHLSQIRKEWSRFYRDNPDATRQQLLDFATWVDDTFGHLFIPPVR